MRASGATTFHAGRLGDKTVAGDQINRVVQVSGAGASYTESHTQTDSQALIIEQLEALIGAVAQAVDQRKLDAVQAVDLQAELQKAKLRAEQGQPEKPKLMVHLERAFELASKAGAAAGALGKGVQAIVALVAKWL